MTAKTANEIQDLHDNLANCITDSKRRDCDTRRIYWTLLLWDFDLEKLTKDLLAEKPTWRERSEDEPKRTAVEIITIFNRIFSTIPSDKRANISRETVLQIILHNKFDEEKAIQVVQEWIQ